MNRICFKNMHGRSMLISLAFEVARPQLLQLNVSNDRDFFGIS